MVEIRCAAENRGRLDSFFQDVVGGGGSVRHLSLRIELKIMDTDSTTEDVEVDEVISNFFGEEMSMKMEVSLIIRPFKGTR